MLVSSYVFRESPRRTAALCLFLENLLKSANYDQWGGESKRDLGFIEGDLIECLNAGDGSWWMGRLHRDKRAMGLFPSNFVQVLDESFRPVTRMTSPMPPTSGSLSRQGSPNPAPQKAKTFRKPFQSYSSTPGPGKNDSNTVNPSPSPQKTQVRKPFQAYAQATTTTPKPSLQPVENRSRAPSPSPTRQPSFLEQPSRHSSRQTSATRQSSHMQRHPRSPSPSIQQYNSRAPSPAPAMQYPPAQLMDDDELYEDAEESSPPPAPPPHRIAYNAPPSRVTPSPTPSMNDRYPTFSRGPSPVPTSPAIPGHTPSPLRDAMEDVMTSLHDMGLHRDESSPTPEQDRPPLDPWSPEAFEELRTNRRRVDRDRPRSSMGFEPAQQLEDANRHETEEEEHYEQPQHDFHFGPPSIDGYAERMEKRLKSMQSNSPRPPDELFLPENDLDPPAPPPKNNSFSQRPTSSMSMKPPAIGRNGSDRKLRNRKSAYELGRAVLDRTFTTKSSATNSSSGVQSVATNSSTNTSRTSQSIMSGYSAGGFSATSAGSLARKKGWGSISRSRPMSVVDTRQDALPGMSTKETQPRPQTPSALNGHGTGYGFRPASTAPGEFGQFSQDSGGLLGGLTAPKAKKSGFFKKLVESAKTGAASARSSIAVGPGDPPRSPIKNLLPNGVTAIAGGSAARDMGLGGKSCTDWVQVRRDVNRSNSLSHNERVERAEKCQMMDYPTIAPVEALYETAQGDEGADGYPVEYPTDFSTVNLQLVDKSARFVNSLPPGTNAASLAQGYVCRPYRSDVQRLRAIFIWASEKVAWEEDFEGDVDTRRVIQMRRGCAEEVAVLVMGMCQSVALHAEVVRGHLKAPDAQLELDNNPRPNHWWNAVIVDNEWRIMDCSLASPSNPKRSQYSSAGPQVAETGWFLARPMEICYTHIASHIQQQHICSPIASDILMALPCTSPSYFRNDLRLLDYDTSFTRIEDLELVHIQFSVPPDIECFAEVEARSYARDADGDIFESGDTIPTRALAQAQWIDGQKRYTVKAYLPGDGGSGTLKVYAGQRGLMHSIRDNPHPLAFTIPIIHSGDNPPYEFLLRHPTPHAQRHDLYVVQPQCARLAVNNTFVFAVRQHPSSLSCSSPSITSSSTSPFPFARPSSAMSMTSSAASTSDYFGPTVASSISSNTNSNSNDTNTSSQQQKQDKPAKLAIQAPSGKILRLMRKSDNLVSASEGGDGGVWETIIKIGERGTWRGLVLADRSARWCVFGEWECF